MYVTSPLTLLFVLSCGETTLFWAFSQDNDGNGIYYKLPLHIPNTVSLLLSKANFSIMNHSKINVWNGGDKESYNSEQSKRVIIEPRLSLFLYDPVTNTPFLFADNFFSELFDDIQEFNGFNNFYKNITESIFDSDLDEIQLKFSYGSTESILLNMITMGEQYQIPNENDKLILFYQQILQEIYKYSLRSLFLISLCLYKQKYICVSDELHYFFEENNFTSNILYKDTELEDSIEKISQIFNENEIYISKLLNETFKTILKHIYYQGNLKQCTSEIKNDTIVKKLLSSNSLNFYKNKKIVLYDKDTGRFIKKGLPGKLNIVQGCIGTNFIDLIPLDIYDEYSEDSFTAFLRTLTI